ncbi:LysR family transcriptional regulator [Ciceribacter sp. RN22]|nr:LysR family transcriptional regulator [Ciceribacter sp. RN22]
MAAEQLGVSQPAVSQQIARFERLSGISIISRNGNSFSVRSDAVAGLIATIVEAENSLRGIARASEKTKPRLGLCDYVAARYCHAIDHYLELGQEYEIHVGRPSSLAEMFGRGELDVAVRPLFHHESTPELMAEVPLVWVGASESWTRGDGDRSKPIPVVLETSQSPYTYYAERLLDEARTPYTILARVDDNMVRSHFLTAGLGCAAIPKFILCSMPGKAAKLPRIPNMAPVRFGVFHNSKTIPFKAAETIFAKLNDGIFAPAGA